MGNTCTTRTKVAIPSRIIMVQSKQTPGQLQNGQHKVKDEPYSITPIRKLSLNLQDNRFLNDGDIETNYTSILPPLKYDLKDLGIGEYYLEDDFRDTKQKSFMRKTSKESLNAKWERVIVKMRQRIGMTTPREESLYHLNDNCIKEYALLKPQKYAKLIKDGPPMRYRWSVWKNSLDMDQFYIRGLYEKFKGLNSTWETDIRKDLNRSFPEEPYFSSTKFEKIGQEQLFNVLKAISLYFPNIGYTQSMNFLVGFLLLINGGNEVEAFWAFVTLAREHKFVMMGLFERNLPLLDIFIHIFYEVLEVEMPAVHAHIKQQQLPDQLWLLKWFMTGFVYSLPPKQVVRIWDFVLEDGILGMVKVALGIIKFMEKDLLNVDIFGMDQLFKHLSCQKKTFNQDKQLSDMRNPEYNASVLAAQNQSLAQNQNVQVEGKDIKLPSMVSIHNETSIITFSFEELDISKVLSFAKKLDLSFSKVSMILNLYLDKVNKPIPSPYNKLLNNWENYNMDSIKLEEFQQDIDYHILKTELSEPVFDEIIVCNLLDGGDNEYILKDLGS